MNDHTKHQPVTEAEADKIARAHAAWREAQRRRAEREAGHAEPPLVKGVTAGTVGCTVRVFLLLAAVAAIVGAIAIGAAIEGGGR